MPGQGSVPLKWTRVKQQLDKFFLNVDAALELLRNAKPNEQSHYLELVEHELRVLEAGLLRMWGEKRDNHVALKRAHRELQEENAEIFERAEIIARTLDSYREEVQAALALAEEDNARKDALIAQLQALIQPPRPYGAFIRANEDGTVDLMFNGQRVSAAVADDVDSEALVPGQRLLLTPQGNVLQAIAEFEDRGEEGIVDELLDDGRVRVTVHTGDNVIAFRSETVSAPDALTVGDHVLFDGRNGYVIEVLPQEATSDLLLEEIPELTYADIGGQDAALVKLRDHLELPLLHPDRFSRYALSMGSGLLLHGPPGGGKTLALKVVANAIRRATERPVFLLSVAGPQLLTMWVGETERKIREPFELAKQKAADGGIVIVLFDEIDAMFPTRGTRVGTSGVGETAVTQFSTMLDGVTEYGNIVVIGTTNRPDMIDPALTRAGRLYPPIEFPRPDRDGVAAIFRVYLGKENFPFHPKYQDPDHPEFDEKVYRDFSANRQNVAEYIVRRLVDRIFGDPGASKREQEQALQRQRVVAIEYEDLRGGRATFFMKDIIS
ncbi:MAG: AAA family ATPase, partial [Candidatus Terrybacteria bacterium]|nr:AAA family ATPase [Candidatus Terrybacteria bacterium]